MTAQPITGQRTVVLLIVVYALLAIVGALATVLPTRALCPEVGLLAVLYLGLSVQRSLPAAATAAFVLGYLVDLLTGAPKGTFSLTLLLVFLATRLLAVRIDVRGAWRMAGFAAAASIVSGILVTIVRGLVSDVPLSALAIVPLQALINAAFAPILMSLYRRIGGPIVGEGRDRGRLRVGMS